MTIRLKFAIDAFELFNLPKFVKRIDVMKLSMVIDTTSPIEAASGVAILSGFTLYLFDNRITATRTKSINGIKR